MQTAPPLYENHRLDRLYDDIDPTGFQTPGLMSGIHTPHGVGSYSRNASTENLASLSDAAHPLALHNRLTNLQIRSETSNRPPMFERHGSGDNTQDHHDDQMTPMEPRRNGHYFDTSSPPLRQNGPWSANASTIHLASARSNGHSPNTSHSWSYHTQTVPQPQEEHDELYDMSRLERLTSYSTAIKTHVRSAPTDVPPTYQTATSPSGSTTPDSLQLPVRAHVARHFRSGHITPG